MEQIIMQPRGAINTMKFSQDGRFLATGGEDAIVRIYSVAGFLVEQDRWRRMKRSKLRGSKNAMDCRGTKEKPTKGSIINPIAYREFHGHKAEVTDIDWSGKNYILSASSDATVMQWHPSESKCIRLFRHADYVSCVRFHPTEQDYYVSASYDSTIRMWHIKDNRVVAWQKLDTLVTALAFSPNGKFIVAGLFDGLCIFFNVDTEPARLRWHHNVECRNKKQSGKRVTSVQYFSVYKETGRNNEDSKLRHGSNQCLVSTNDSRIRLYTLENYHINLKTKYKGHKNTKFMSGASFSDDGEFVICG